MRKSKTLALLSGVFLFACAGNGPDNGTRSMADLVFLTRDGCADSKMMGENLNRALSALRLPRDYQVLDLERLPPADPRRGYPTPTLLLGNKDVFGMPEPKPPFPPPT